MGRIFRVFDCPAYPKLHMLTCVLHGLHGIIRKFVTLHSTKLSDSKPDLEPSDNDVGMCLKGLLLRNIHDPQLSVNLTLINESISQLSKCADRSEHSQG